MAKGILATIVRRVNLVESDARIVLPKFDRFDDL
jgi:hypothetical protein